ncbi:MAG: hypothetical protein NC111_05370 [Bacteroides sp.]|nr:hypothetical protein [Bacteroides sp.]MCM1413376.1 hypothetical protein [Bacteroides sp.]MCM1471938.1 hypothetical protein [Bacteroides sp.]
MKKILFSAAIVAMTAMFAACGKSNKEANADDSVTVEEVDVTEVAVLEGVEAPTESEATGLLDNIKSAATQENVTKGLAYVQSLIQNGKVAEAKTYLDQLKPYADKVGLSSAVSSVEGVLAKAETLNLNDAATNATDALKDKAQDVEESTKAKIEDKAKDITDKAAAGVDKGVDKVKEGVQKGADAVKGLF